MKYSIYMFLFIILLTSCTTDKRILIENIQGDLWIRQIASDNQNSIDLNQIDTNISGIPLKGIPSIHNQIITSGMFSDHSVIIKSVSGSVYIEEFGNRNKAINITDLLDKVYISNDPFKQ